MLKITIIAILIAIAHAQTGGFIPQPVVSAHVVEIADWAATTMSTSQSKHTVVAVKNLMTQVVAGTNYKFTLELLVDKKATKVCDVIIFDQPWTNTRKFISEPVCSQLQQLTAVGSFVPQATVSDKVKEIAAWSAAALSTEDVHTVMEIKNVQTQLVAGMNYKFTLVLSVNNKPSKTCEMSVYESLTGARKFFAEPRCYASRAMVGGFVDQPVVSAEAMEVAQWAASELSAIANGAQHPVSHPITHSVTAVKNLQTKIVNGIIYKFKLELLVSHAPSMAILKKTCDLEVYVQSWTNTRRFNQEPKCGGTF